MIIDLLRGRADAVDLKSLAVLRARWGSVLASALFFQDCEEMIQKGYRAANLCLIRDGNPSARLDGGRGTVSRRYVLFRQAGRPVDE